METMDLRCFRDGLVLCVTTFVKKDVALQIPASSNGILCYDSGLAANDIGTSAFDPCENFIAAGTM